MGNFTETRGTKRGKTWDAQALNCLSIDVAGCCYPDCHCRCSGCRRKMLDWHSQRGLSFLQLGLREIERLCYQRLPIPRLATLPRKSPLPATASLKKRTQIQQQIEFSRVTVFST